MLVQSAHPHAGAAVLAASDGDDDVGADRDPPPACSAGGVAGLRAYFDQEQRRRLSMSGSLDASRPLDAKADRDTHYLEHGLPHPSALGS